MWRTEHGEDVGPTPVEAHVPAASITRRDGSHDEPGVLQHGEVVCEEIRGNPESIDEFTG